MHIEYEQKGKQSDDEREKSELTSVLVGFNKVINLQSNSKGQPFN